MSNKIYAGNDTVSLLSMSSESPDAIKEVDLQTHFQDYVNEVRSDKVRYFEHDGDQDGSRIPVYSNGEISRKSSFFLYDAPFMKAVGDKQGDMVTVNLSDDDLCVFMAASVFKNAANNCLEGSFNKEVLKIMNNAVVDKQYSMPMDAFKDLLVKNDCANVLDNLGVKVEAVAKKAAKPKP